MCSNEDSQDCSGHFPVMVQLLRTLELFKRKDMQIRLKLGISSVIEIAIYREERCP
jgi:hypothetical protein